MLHCAIFAVAQENCSCAGITDVNRNALDADSLLKTKQPACVIQGFRIKGRALLIRRELDSAEIFLNKAINLLEKQGCPEDEFLIFYGCHFPSQDRVYLFGMYEFYTKRV
mgnify:CR=1 FL=1